MEFNAYLLSLMRVGIGKICNRRKLQKSTLFERKICNREQKSATKTAGKGVIKREKKRKRALYTGAMDSKSDEEYFLDYHVARELDKQAAARAGEEAKEKKGAEAA